MKALRGLGNKSRVFHFELQQFLSHTRQQGDVAADVGLDIQAGDLCAEQQTADITGDSEIDESQLFRRIDDDDISATPPDLHQAAHQTRVVRSGIAADQHVQIGFVEVFEANCSGACSDAGCQTDSARLVTIVRAIVDIVRAEQSRKQLQQEAGFIGGPPAGVEKAASGSGPLQPGSQPFKRFVPRDDSIMSILGPGIDRMDQPATRFHLRRTERAELAKAILGEELGRDPRLHVRNHRLE